MDIHISIVASKDMKVYWFCDTKTFVNCSWDLLPKKHPKLEHLTCKAYLSMKPIAFNASRISSTSLAEKLAANFSSMLNTS